MFRALPAAVCLALLALGATAAARELVPGSGGIVLRPVMPQPDAAAPLPSAAPAPHATGYVQQLAQRLGLDRQGLSLVRPGHADPYTPAVSFNGSMVRLRWQP